MALKPIPRCSYPGCTERSVIHYTVCQKHLDERNANRNLRRDLHRGSATDRGYDWHWRQLSTSHLKKEPLCRHCMKQDKLTDATLTDHIVPVVVDPSRRLDPTNLQSLCYQCHTKKTMEDMKMYPQYFREVAKIDVKEHAITTPNNIERR